ncbi:hypothetical protein ILYODFUR_026431 [Ilyodon furcidens]|uniref:Uncharacterized protein n=1 Tax=Ilyodon furcidens TaxID=33524 RepID=A0ABV0V973_9TELE
MNAADMCPSSLSTVLFSSALVQFQVSDHVSLRFNEAAELDGPEPQREEKAKASLVAFQKALQDGCGSVEQLIS